jgi:hypothetical protein
MQINTLGDAVATFRPKPQVISGWWLICYPGWPLQHILLNDTRDVFSFGI